MKLLAAFIFIACATVSAFAQVPISALPTASLPLAGSEIVPLVQSGVTKSAAVSTIAGYGGNAANPTAVVGLTPVNGSSLAYMRSDAAPALSTSLSPTMTGAWDFTGSVTLGNLTGSSQCLQVNSSGLIGGTGGACASGGITALTGDCTASGAGSVAITCTKTGGATLGTFATQNYATPPAIGGTTPAAGHFTTGSFTGALTTNVTGSAQCLQVNSSGVVAGTGSACASGSGTSGLVLLQTVSADNTKASYTFSSLSGYTDLILVVRGKCDGTGVNFSPLSITFNSDNTSGDYYYSTNASEGATFSYSTATGNPGSSGIYGGYVGSMTALGFGDNPYMPSTTEITISNYNNTSWYKMVQSRSDMGLERYSWYNATVLTTMVWNNTAAITTLTLSCDANFPVGDVISLYGRNG